MALKAVAVAAILVAGLSAACSRSAGNQDVSSDQIANLLRLRTYEQVYRAIGYMSNERTVLFFKTVDREVLYSIQIHVQAGIDASDPVAIERTAPGEVRIDLPPARILSIDADESSIRQYFSRERGGAVSLLEYGDQIEELKKSIEAEALRRGILDAADAHARALVASLFRNAGFDTVRFAGEAH